VAGRELRRPAASTKPERAVRALCSPGIAREKLDSNQGHASSVCPVFVVRKPGCLKQLGHPSVNQAESA
jgi:hypothetical protein